MNGKRPRLSEKDFQRQVLQFARLHGWLCHHARPARTARGWRTPIEGDRGYLDVTMAHPRRRLFLVVELKADDGQLDAAQATWLRAMLDAGVDARVWRPRDWQEVQETLRGG